MSARAFRPGLGLTLQAGAALATVVALSIWQVSRALEKSALQSARVERLRGAPIAARDYRPETPDFTRVQLEGRYDDERHFLLPAAARRPGAPVQVVSVLRTDFGSFLVNRGWFASAEALRTPTGAVSAVGVAWPAAARPVAAAATPPDAPWPRRLPAMHVARMAAESGTHARELRLAGGSPGVARPASLAWDYSPGMHWGYAAQWLLIGAAIGVGYAIIGLRRGRTP